MAKATKQDWLSLSRITSREDALKAVKDTSMVFFVLAGVQGVLGFLLAAAQGSFGMLFDGALIAIGGFFVRRLHSRAAAVILLLVAIVGTVLKFVGGKNIIVALIVLWVAIKAVEATFKLHGRFAETAASDEAASTQS